MARPMAKRDQLVICPTCGEVNNSENLSCRACLGDLTGKASGHTGQSQLAQLHRLAKALESTNRRLSFLIFSIWLIFALVVGWTVVAGIVGVGGPAALFRWPF